MTTPPPIARWLLVIASVMALAALVKQDSLFMQCAIANAIVAVGWASL